MIHKQVENGLSIYKVQNKEIADFIASKHYKSLSVKPISVPRALSYYQNPRAEADDVVIYLLYRADELIGFRTILPDYAYDGTKQIKFGWCSGNWIAPAHRRNGYSTLLLKEAYHDWSHKLMYTNYAQSSYFLYTKSNLFTSLKQRKGLRFYGAVNMDELLKYRKGYRFIRIFLPLVNLGVGIAARMKRLMYTPYKLNVNDIEVRTDYTPGFIDSKLNAQSLFKRDDDDFSWIHNYRWISDDPALRNLHYPFSAYDGCFRYYYVQIHIKDKAPLKLMLSHRSRHLKVLYSFIDSDPGKAARFIMNFCYEQHIQLLTVLDRSFAGELSKIRKPFVTVKPYKMNIFTTFSVREMEKLKIHDGDGDYVFT